MIKFTGTEDGKPLFGFGLSQQNINLLKSGRPIKVDLEPMGFSGFVVIFYGRTEQEMVDELNAAGAIDSTVTINRQTQIHEG